MAHYEFREDFTTGNKVLLVPPAPGGGFRDSDGDLISAEIFYEFIVPGFRARGMGLWDRDAGKWLLSPRVRAA